jgi:hypothetical protein
VNPTPTAGERVEVRSSRLWAFLTVKMTRFIFPAYMSADSLGISTTNIKAWYVPWVRQDEHLPMTHIAEVSHDRGFFWDSISVESSGGLNPLMVSGVPKGSARRFVDFVRAGMNVPPAQTTQPPSQLRR